jgi:hypothetical protein
MMTSLWFSGSRKRPVPETKQIFHPLSCIFALLSHLFALGSCKKAKHAGSMIGWD